MASPDIAAVSLGRFTSEASADDSFKSPDAQAFASLILGTHNEVTRELHEEGSRILAKDSQILVSGLILKKNGKQKHSHTSNGSLIKNNNNNGTIISYWFFQFYEINLKHFKLENQDKMVDG
ncbi:hypothetical protein DUI87_18651 [Hirundo rustica rustica]|uniref:Uncharacterized protein n=1 Tax=Hirundo rustica rustica TaxID=333673 RepID=A0A3M0JXH0_HIRRU|nr:hypothetical protein DUI87_18651 [Hirundo rustica rustica]